MFHNRALEGAFPRLRHWISRDVRWENILDSEGDREELEHLKTQIIARQERLPDRDVDPVLVSRA